MPVVTIAPKRPAPPVPAPRADEPKDPAIGLAVGKFLLWTATIKPIAQAVALAGMCLYWLVNQTYQGRFRYHLRPLWVAMCAMYVTPWTPWAWLTAAYLLAFAPNPGRWVSGREQAILARGCALAAAFQVFAPTVDRQTRAGLLAEFTVAGLWEFWYGRAWRSTPEVDEIHPMVEAWEWQVAEHPKAGPLAGTELRHDPGTGRFHLRAPIDGAEGVERADILACRLMSRPRGTVTISIDPEGDANDFLVAFTDRSDATVVRYADGPSLDEHGTVAIADTADGRTIRVPIYTPAGAAHFLILATNRYGKGVIVRALAVELCLWDKAFLITIDAKGDDDGGAGIPELRGYADVYARRKTQWKAAVHLEHELFQARSRRYGGAGAAFWHPDKPVDGYCDPLIAAIKDELRNIRKSLTRVEIDMLEQLSSMGATYGIAQIGDTQKGDADSTFSTAWRNDVRGNGTVFAGRAGDAQAAGIAAQDFNIDLNRLPTGRGWWIIKTGLLDVPLVPARGRLYPSRDEVAFQPGIEAPHGTVEDWLVGTKRAKLHPEDQEIVERWRPEFEETPAPSAVDPGDVVADLSGGVMDGEVVEVEPVREVVQVADGVHVEHAPRLSVVPDLQPDTKAALDLIPDIVRKAGVMTRGEIAAATGLSPEYTSDRLKKLKEMRVMTEARTGDGRPGWRVVA